MKKKIIICATILILFLIACLYIYQNKDNKDYTLIEITGQELLDVFVDDEEASITFALYNERDIQAEDFYKDLEKTSRQAHQNIYYVNTSHVTFEFEEIINTLTSRQPDILSYYVIKDGKILISKTYEGFNQLYKDLNGKKFDTKIPKTSKEKKLEYISQAQEAYKEGNIAGAHQLLAGAWDLQEAKDEWNNKPYYKLIGNWEHFEVQPDGKNTRYLNIFITTYTSHMYVADEVVEIEGFTEPELNKYKQYEIQIKDDWIYTKDPKTNKFKKKYEIIKSGMYSLELKDGETTYTFQYGY